MLITVDPLSAQENSWHGLSGRFNYTYSHAFDEVSNGGIANEPFSVITSIGVQIDPYNLRSNYGPADYDVRHQLSASYRRYRTYGRCNK
jgi:hypothetical protein